MPGVKSPETKQIPVREHLFTLPELSGESPKLIGIKCNKCGEVVFPRKTICPNCCSNDVKEMLIGPQGKLYSYTVIYQPAPIGYKGPVPYSIVKVEMPEGLRITGHATVNSPAELKIGMKMELIIDKMFSDTNGNDIIGFKFKPVK
ncbi:MAG: Zn-ribbon domain-containing OB-fold protein [Dehalococcoidales bacterium]|nr:Zn-ribbon domain-containing OB-fold protein [Dehalococcoidales bacterium]